MKITQYMSVVYVLVVAVITALAWLPLGLFGPHLFGVAGSYLMGLLLLSALTYGLYAKDKRAARLGLRRTPEKTLHGLALVGGWPGALLAQARFNHKTQKQPFKAILWLSILVHLLLVALLLKLVW